MNPIYALKEVGQRVVHGLLLMAAGASAHAQSVPDGGIVAYEPVSLAPVTVPTLGEWALVTMALAVAVVAYVALRRRTRGAAVMALLGMALALGSLPRAPAWLGQAQALPGTPSLVEMTSTAQTLNGLSGAYEFRNVNAVPYKITVVDVSGPLWSVFSADPGGSPECAANLVVPPGGSCFVRFVQPT